MNKMQGCYKGKLKENKADVREYDTDKLFNQRLLSSRNYEDVSAEE